MSLCVIVIIVSLQLIHAEVMNLTCDQIQKFVDGHNLKRQQLAQGLLEGHPAASEMKKMVWDEELAAKARGWASENKFEHNPDVDISSGRFKTGENLHRYSATYINPDKDIINKAMDSWWTENKDFQYREMNSSDFDGPLMVGHYTQMAWANSTYMGCGISQYDENEWHHFITVCNYGPSGNIIGEKPYPSGSPSNELICGVENCNKLYGDGCSNDQS